MSDNSVPYVLKRIHHVMNNADFPSFNLKAKQVICLEYLLKKQDVIAVFPTGYGKSFIFHVLPDLFPQKVPGLNNIVIVVCPLNSIVKDQIDVLLSRGISADVLRVSQDENMDRQTPTLFDLENVESECQIPDTIVSGANKIVFCHPEAILSKEGRKLMKSEEYQQRVVAWVIDEAHCIKIWGENFRVQYMELCAVRSFFPDIPVLALTATAPPQTVSLLKETLAMECPKVVKVYPNRKNIFLNKRYRLDSCYGFESYERILKPVAFDLMSKKGNYPMTIIYMKLKYCGYAYRLFEEIIGQDQYAGENAQPRCRLFAQFHAPQTNQMKSEILEEIKNETSNIRVIFATSALGMGVDAPGITRVIHIGPPSTLESYLQEIGRAGRRGQESIANLFFCNSDISQAKVNKGLVHDSVVEYCKNSTECQRKLLMEYFGFHFDLSQSRCCCICDESFGQKQNDCGPKRTLRNVNMENYLALSNELFCYAKDKDSKIQDDCYDLFAESPNILPPVIHDILNNIEHIYCEKDLLTDFGIWDEFHSSQIFSIICKYSKLSKDNAE